jgi:hypothetical protein
VLASASCGRAAERGRTLASAAERRGRSLRAQRAALSGRVGDRWLAGLPHGWLLVRALCAMLLNHLKDAEELASVHEGGGRRELAHGQQRRNRQVHHRQLVHDQHRAGADAVEDHSASDRRLRDYRLISLDNISHPARGDGSKST